MLGLDGVFYFTFRTGNSSIDAEIQNSEWFQTSYEKFTSRALNADEPIILEGIFGDADKYTRSYFEGYGEMPTRTFFADGSYNFRKKKIAQKLFDENLEMFQQLVDPMFDIANLMRNNDVFNESYKLFSGDAKNRIYTIVDETFTVSKESGNRRIDRKNLIRADWFDTKTFAKKDEVPCYITIIRKFTKGKQSKKLFTIENQKGLYRLKQKGNYLEYIVKRNQANYIASILRNEEGDYTYYTFQIKARNEKSLDIIKDKLLEAPWLNKKGKTRIIGMHKNWVNRLNKAKLNQKNPGLTISLNEFEVGWLLERLGRIINLVFNDLFEIFVCWYKQEEETLRNQIWNKAIYGKLTKENFYKHMSFGLIPKGSFAGRTRTVYEVNSNEIQNFIHTVCSKYMQIALYATENPWLSWAGELVKVLKSLLF